MFLSSKSTGVLSRMPFFDWLSYSLSLWVIEQACSVKMAEIGEVLLCVYIWTETKSNSQKRTRLDSQSQRAIWFILPAFVTKMTSVLLLKPTRLCTLDLDSWKLPMFLKLAYLLSELRFSGKYLFWEHQISMGQLAANSSMTETLTIVLKYKFKAKIL